MCVISPPTPASVLTLHCTPLPSFICLSVLPPVRQVVSQSVRTSIPPSFLPSSLDLSFSRSFTYQPVATGPALRVEPLPSRLADSRTRKLVTVTGPAHCTDGGPSHFMRRSESLHEARTCQGRPDGSSAGRDSVDVALAACPSPQRRPCRIPAVRRSRPTRGPGSVTVPRPASHGGVKNPGP